jgi:hypothetical protein
VIDWLLEGDRAVRWQVLRDLTDASPDEVAAERARVEHEGWGARLLALEGADGLWEGGACFPAAYTGGEPGQPWTATMREQQALMADGPHVAAGGGVHTGQLGVLGLARTRIRDQLPRLATRGVRDERGPGGAESAHRPNLATHRR